MNERPPIIVLGANHSGTRVVVDILRACGSDGGRIDNEWLENRTFLDIHRRLIDGVSTKGWTGTVFDMEFVRGFRDDGRWVPDIRDWLERSLADGFPDRASKPWHWKCPTAIMFLPSWLEIYPDALYVHIERNPDEVARSLVRRRQFIGFGRAQAFYHAMNQRILDCRPAMRRYIRLSYENLPAELPLLAEQAGLDPDPETLRRVRRGIDNGYPKPWRADRSAAGNLWEALTYARAAAHRLLGGWRRP